VAKGTTHQRIRRVQKEKPDGTEIPQIVQAVPGIQLNMGMSGFGLSIGPRDRGKGERERPGDVWLRTHD